MYFIISDFLWKNVSMSYLIQSHSEGEIINTKWKKWMSLYIWYFIPCIRTANETVSCYSCYTVQIFCHLMLLKTSLNLTGEQQELNRGWWQMNTWGHCLALQVSFECKLSLSVCICEHKRISKCSWNMISLLVHLLPKFTLSTKFKGG